MLINPLADDTADTIPGPTLSKLGCGEELAIFCNEGDTDTDGVSESSAVPDGDADVE